MRQTVFLRTSRRGQAILAARSRLRGARVAVVGLGRLSGVAAVRVLSELGARVVINDIRSEEELAPILAPLRADPTVSIESCVLGDHPTSLADEVEWIVLSPGVPYDLPMLVSARERGVPTIGELELAYEISDAPFIAVTGTKGKSTTTTLIGRMLADRFPGHVTVAGNIGVPLSQEVRRLGPEDVIVAEVSSFQLESIVGFRPRIGAVLNISPDHLDRHGTMDAYIAAKRRLTENQREDDLLIVNDDDPIARAFAEKTRARVLRFSLTRRVEDGAFVRQERIYWSEDGHATEIGRADALRVPGRHNVANTLAAIAVVAPLGVQPDAMLAAIESFRGLEHAYEPVSTRAGVQYVDDSKSTNVASVCAALEATRTGRVVLIMGGIDKGNDYGPLKPLMSARVRHLIALGENAERLIDAFGGRLPITSVGSMQEAVATAARFAEPGDTVLLSPGHASFDLFHDWKERGDAFKDAVRHLA